MRVLDIDVPADLLASWRRWLAPETQPFYVAHPTSYGLRAGKRDASPEQRDTFRLWKVSKDLPVVSLSEAQFGDLPRPTRARLVREQFEHGRGAVPAVRAWSDLLDAATLRAQADGHRFVWWPALIDDDVAEAVLTRVIEHHRLPSRHREVPSEVWQRAAAGAQDEWLLPPAFEDWLARTTRSGGDDDEPGTVLVWRDSDGGAQHSAVTLGDGWAIEKPSQEWSSPRSALTVPDLIRTNRTKGLRVRRYSMRQRRRAEHAT